MGVMTAGLSEALFSKTQRKVLALLFGRPDRSYYANEIVRYAEAGIGSVQRELERLTRVGLITVESIGNQRHYRANPASPIFEEMRGIVLKTFGVTACPAWSGIVIPGREEAASDFGVSRFTSDILQIGQVPGRSEV